MMKRISRVGLFSLLVVSISVCANPQSVYGVYQGESPRYGKRSLEIGPDKFKNRVRYWFVSPDGSPSVYEVAEKIKPGTYQQLTVNNEGGAARLIFKGDTATLQGRYVGKVVDSTEFRKIIK